MTVAIAAAAWWFTGDPIRAVAVLVVATPCPLILAVPVALVAGLSRAAHFGRADQGRQAAGGDGRGSRTLILDKTGTLTDGRPQIVSIDSRGGIDADEVLRLAAALDQASKHPVAQAHRRARRGRAGLRCPVPTAWPRRPGEGVAGHRRRPPGRGRRRGLRGGAGRACRAMPRVAGAAGSVVVAVAVDGRLAGPSRDGRPPARRARRALLAGLRRQGIAASCWRPATAATWPSA